MKLHDFFKKMDKEWAQPENGRTTLYVIPKKIIATIVKSEEFIDPPNKYKGSYVKHDGKFVRVHSDYKMQTPSPNKEYAILLFEAYLDAPERNVHKGKQQEFAVPYPFATEVIEICKKGGWLGLHYRQAAPPTPDNSTGT